MSKKNQLLAPFDPFKDAEEQETCLIKGYVDIRVTARSTKSKITTIEGLTDAVDHKKLAKTLQSVLSCGCNVETSEKFGKVIKVQGDNYEDIVKYLIKNDIADKSRIRVH